MRVFIANFGLQNFLWPECKRRPSIATLEPADMYPLWVAGDREAYVDRALTQKMTVRGEVPTRPVASRWFGLMDTISTTEGDIWFHREKNELWWTVSKADPVQIELHSGSDNPHRPGVEVFQFHKPAEPWSDRTRTGAPLSWVGLHPKAKDFLFTEGTLQQLSPDNAAYALALIAGEDLAPWHDQPAWKSKSQRSGRGEVTYADACQKAVWEMATQVEATCRASSGQEVSRTVKNKEMRFASKERLMDYIKGLIADQDGLCAVSGIRLQFKSTADDPELICSLDRIDSDGHYEPGNLQVVCRFANRWKNDSDDADFRRLIGLVRSTSF